MSKVLMTRFARNAHLIEEKNLVNFEKNLIKAIRLSIFRVLALLKGTILFRKMILQFQETQG